MSKSQKAQDYSFKANVKRLADARQPDRNTPFEDIRRVPQLFLRQGWPMVRLDAKKKELRGNFKSAVKPGGSKPSRSR